MKPLFTPILLAAALVLPAMSFADDNHSRHKHSMMKKLDKIVDLTDAQKAQIADLPMPGKPPKPHKLLHAVVQLDPTSATYQADLETLANQAAEQAHDRVLAMAARTQDVKAVLTQEQLDKLYAFHAEKHDKRSHF